MASSDHPPNRTKSRLPLYVQIAEGLLDQIELGSLRTGDRLTPERELSETLGVSRMTLRRALRMLETHGMLERLQGDGTYVAEPLIERQAGKLVPFTRGMRRRGYAPGAKVITFEQRPAEASLASRLRLPVSGPVYYIQRLRSINGQPVMLETFTMPVRRFPALERFDLESRSVYEIMQMEYGVLVNRARQSLEPVIATDYEAGWLGIQPGDALMLERRLSLDENDRPVEYGKDLYRGDRFRFVTESAPLEREDSSEVE